MTPRIPTTNTPRSLGWNRAAFAGFNLLLALGLQAGTTWSGGGLDSNIDTAANWNDGVNPAYDGSAGVTFGTGGTGAVIDVPVAFAGLAFNANSDFSITGANTLTNLTGNITASIPGATPHTYTIACPLTGTNQVWNIANNGVASGTTLIFSNQVSGGGVRTNLGDGTLIIGGSGNNNMGIFVGGGGLVLLQKSSGNAIGGGPGYGASVVTNGTVRLDGTGTDQIGDYCNFYVTNRGVIDLNGKTEKIGSSHIGNDGTGNGAIINSSTNVATLIGSPSPTSTSLSFDYPEASIGGPGNIIINHGINSGNGRYIYKLSKNTLTICGTNATVGGIFVVCDGTMILDTTNAQAVSSFGVTNGILRFAGQGGDLCYDLGQNFVTNAGVLDLNGRSEVVKSIAFGGTNGLSVNGALINSSTTPATLTATLTITTNMILGGIGDITLNGAVHGNNTVTALTKIGPGVLTMTSNIDNSSLGVTLNAGTLVMNKDNSSGYVSCIGGPGLVINGAAARLDQSEQIYDGSSVTATNGGVFDLHGQTETLAWLRLGGAGAGLGALVNSASAASTITATLGTVLVQDTAIGGAGDIALNSSVQAIGVVMTKVGNDILTLSGDNTNFTGTAIINAGTLALNGYCTFANAALVSVGGGATFDVTGLSVSPFVLGAAQTLSNSASASGTLSGSLDASLGTIAVSYTAGTPSLSVANGTLTLGAGTVVNVNNTGASLAGGTYRLISKASGGTVSGVAPSLVTVGGSGATGTASLQINDGELDLVVVSSTPAPTRLVTSVNGSQLVLSWPIGQGWKLQAQTNSPGVGLTTNWVDVAGAVSPWTNSAVPTVGSVFYRLEY